MRKESIGRLLLSLLTAFVMVAGVFGAAIYSVNEDWSVTPNQEIIQDDIAASELDEGIRETGDAPVSAYNDEGISIFKTDGLDVVASKDVQDQMPQLLTEEIIRERVPDKTEDETVEDFKEKESKLRDENIQISELNSVPVSVVDNHGTRSSDIFLDPGGPHGTPDDPEYEGVTLPFEAHVYDTSEDPPEDISDDYQFRWSFRDDGVFTDWTTPPGAQVVPYAYTDDYIGKARVQAWDGTTTQQWSPPVPVQDEPEWQFIVVDFYTEDTMTVGWSFDVNQDCRIEEFALYRYSSGLTWQDVDAIRVWERDTTTLVGELLNPLPEPSDDSWQWYTLSTPIDLSAGTTYIVAAVYYYNGGVWPEAFASPGPTPDGVIDPIQLHEGVGDVFPGTALPYGAWCTGLDFRYSVLEADIPIVIEALADVFVWNLNPTVFGASVTPAEHIEGAGGEAFTAWLSDPGIDDEWWFMWDWGDGEVTEWMPVPLWGGGARLLFLNALTSMAQATFDAIEAELGPNAMVFENYDITGNTPTLEYLLEFDAVLVACWGYPDDYEALGDVLADYSDLGGGVVQCGGSFWPSPPGQMGIMGRWLDDEYNAIEYTVPQVLTLNLDAYDASHPIMDGVTEITSNVNHPLSTSTTTYSYWVADWDNGAVAVAATDVGHHGITDSGRIVGFNTYINQPTYVTGDAVRLIANALMWASQQPNAYRLYPPIQLPAVDHIFVDDHPTTLTPSDAFYPSVIVRDDDHCEDRMIGDLLEYLEDFNSAWGTYGNNPPPGWTIRDDAPVPDIWEWGAPSYGPSSAHSGSNCWGTDLDDDYVNNLDNWLMGPAIDLSSYTGATLSYWLYYDLENNYDFLLVEISADGSSWTQIASYTGTGGQAWTQYSHDIHDLAGDDEIFFRFRLDTDSSVYVGYSGAYIDDVDILGYTGGTTSTTFIDEGFEGSFEPAGWTQVVYSGTGTWEQTAYGDNYPPPGSGTYFAEADDDDAPYGTDYDVGLFTSSMDLTGATYVEVIFERNFQDYAGYGEAAVNTYSGGTTASDFEEQLWFKTTDDPSSGVHTVLNFDPSSYADPSDVYIEFYYNDENPSGVHYDSGAWKFAIDDVLVRVPGDPGTPDSSPFYEEDFEADDGGYIHGAPPLPWDNNDWHRYLFSTSYPGGTGTYAARVYYSPLENQDEWLISPTFDLSDPSFTSAVIEFDTFFNTGYDYAEGHVLISIDGGATWITLDTYVYPTDVSGHQTYDITSIAMGETNVQVAFRYMGYNDWYWFIDNFYLVAIPEIRHVVGISDPAEVTKIIHNVFPSVVVPEGFIMDYDENIPVVFDEFEVTDPALRTGTEEIWYRWDMDDGSSVGPWINVPPGTGIMYEDYELGTGWHWPPWNMWPGYVAASVETYAAHDGNYGLEFPDFNPAWYYRTDLSIGNPGDMMSVWCRPDNTGTTGGRIYIGFGATTSECYTFQLQPNTNSIAIGYNPFPVTFITLATTPYSGWVADQWYRAEVEFLPGNAVVGRMYDSDGTTLLAEVTASGIGNLPGGLAMRGFYYWDMDTWDNGAPSIDPVIPTFTHLYADNGIYNVDFQAIDDDMWWDLSGPQPVFVGPNRDPNNPGADPDDWISHNTIPVEIYNVDPEISPITAEISLDMAIRVTGEPDNPTTMALYKGSTKLNEVTIEHDGNQQIAVMPATLDMLTINDYYLKVTYQGSGGGATPTWIFQGRFGSGHIKELKRVFKDGMDPWIIGPEYLKQMIVGEDITFRTKASDPGSDDLAFVWNYGDTTPHGIHVYANKDPTVAVNGVSLPEPELFGVLTNGDPWFDRTPNTIRSPDGRSILVEDTITHAFSGSYFYYVTLIVVDDDAAEDPPYLPNEQEGLIDGTDCEYITIDLST